MLAWLKPQSCSTVSVQKAYIVVTPAPDTNPLIFYLLITQREKECSVIPRLGLQYKPWGELWISMHPKCDVYMMTSSNGTFSRYWPFFVRGIHRSPVNSPHKGQWRGAFDVFFDLRLNIRLCKQSCGWWFETPSRPLWGHSNGSVAPSSRCTRGR